MSSTATADKAETDRTHKNEEAGAGTVEAAISRSADIALGVSVLGSALVVALAAGLPAAPPLVGGVVGLLVLLLGGWALSALLEGLGDAKQHYHLAGVVLALLAAVGLDWLSLVPPSLADLAAPLVDLGRALNDKLVELAASLVAQVPAVGPLLAPAVTSPRLAAVLMLPVVLRLVWRLEAAGRGLLGLYLLGLLALGADALGADIPGLAPWGVCCLASYPLAAGVPRAQWLGLALIRGVCCFAGALVVGDGAGVWAFAVCTWAVELSTRVPNTRRYAVLAVYAAIATAPLWSGLAAGVSQVLRVPLALAAVALVVRDLRPGHFRAWSTLARQTLLTRREVTLGPSLLNLDPPGWLRRYRVETPLPALPTNAGPDAYGGDLAARGDELAVREGEASEPAGPHIPPLSAYRAAPPARGMGVIEIGRLIESLERALRKCNLAGRVRVVGHEVGPTLLTVQMHFDAPDTLEDLRKASAAVRSQMGLAYPVTFRLADARAGGIDCQILRDKAQALGLREYFEAARSLGSPVIVALNAAGKPIHWHPEATPVVLVVGRPNRGKSTFLRSLALQCLIERDEEGLFASAKPGEFSAFADYSMVQAYSPEEFARAVRELGELVAARYQILADAKAAGKIADLSAAAYRAAGGTMSPITMFADEINVLLGAFEEEERERLQNAVDRLATSARAAGVRMVLGLHDPEILGPTTRNNAGVVVCVDTTAEISEAVLGGCADASQLTEAPGDCYVLVPGQPAQRAQGLPVLESDVSAALAALGD